TADIGGKIEVARNKFTASVEKKCENVAPADALYASCPIPCDTDAPSVSTFDDVATCLLCMDHARLKAFAEEAYGSPANASLTDGEIRCHQSIIKASAKLLTSALKSVATCQTTDEESGITTIDHCTDTQYVSLISTAHSRAYDMIATGACADATLTPALDPCGGSLSAASLASCVTLQADNSAQLLVSRYLELPTTTTTTTTTTLPSSIAACPGSAEIVTDAGYGSTCSSNVDCDAPRTCDSLAGRCTTATRLALGTSGIGHGKDTNDGDKLDVLLSCPGPAGPGCGECAVAGIDPAADNCRCSNSNGVCTGMSDSSADCPMCGPGPKRGLPCTLDAECSVSGGCARHCLSPSSQTCTSNADCPGSACSSLTKCSNNAMCSTNADCTGTCSGQAACDCFVDTPTPLVFGGTPACLLTKLSQDIAGTLNVDSGSSALAMHTRLVTYLGDLVVRPCPVCGGVCSNNSALACTIDSDCDVGNSCIQDTPGDEIRGGLCIGGRNAGASCDVDATNSSLPAHADA